MLYRCILWCSTWVPHPWQRSYSISKANTTSTLPPELLCIHHWLIINYGENCSVLYICMFMYACVYSKEKPTFLIHTNGANKIVFSDHTHWKKISALYFDEKNPLCLWKHVQKIFQPDQIPLEVKWSLPYIIIYICKLCAVTFTVRTPNCHV